MLTCAGLEPVGNTAGNPARFIVETFSAGRGDLTVTVLNPRGVQEPASIITKNFDDRLHHREARFSWGEKFNVTPNCIQQHVRKS